MKPHRLLPFLLCCFLLAAPLFAGPQPSPTQAADQLFAQSKWEQAAQAYSDITAKDPTNGQAWQNLGESFLQQRQIAPAVAAFTHAIDAKYRPVLNQLNLARAYAAGQDRSKALAQLQQLIDAGNGPLLRPYFLHSTEFSALSADPEFQKLLAKTLPCLSPEYHYFDFWIGEWEVQNPAGKPIGHNSVTREQDGCLLVEHWKSAIGNNTGTSFNYYDLRDKKWHQLYLDNSGNAGNYPPMAGTLTDGKMVMLTDPAVSPVSRWTWYVVPPGKVRQMAEQSTDHQKTWSTTWDSTYVISKPSPASN